MSNVRILGLCPCIFVYIVCVSVFGFVGAIHYEFGVMLCRSIEDLMVRRLVILDDYPWHKYVQMLMASHIYGLVIQEAF